MAAGVAKKDAVVYDENMEIHRQIVAGQPVPLDLVDAYEQETGEKVERSGIDGTVASADAAKAADEQTAKAREADDKQKAERRAARQAAAGEPTGQSSQKSK